MHAVPAIASGLPLTTRDRAPDSMCETARERSEAEVAMRQTGFVGAMFGGALLCAALVACTATPADSAAAGSTSRPTRTAAATAEPTAHATPDAPAPAGEAAGDTVPLAPADPPAPPTSAPNAPGTIGSSLPRCIDEQLVLAYFARPQDSGAGSFYGDLVFTNISGSDCSVDGWPGVIAQNSGVKVGAPASREGASSATVVLAANGGVATARLHGTQPGAYDCPATASTHLRAFVTSDGGGPGVYVTQSIPVCGDSTATLGVGPFTAG